MKAIIKRLINIAETTEDWNTKERILNEIADIISEFATTYNCPSDWREIGELLAEEYKNNNYIFEALSLWEYEEIQ